ncbi:L-alanine dehydrogenase [Alkalispirochaeta americana]|uniref:Alanine dehydrogenase n=1 Tax=Alkalispirochaeta americana TaxID=159291 RepID=A0A1N6T229_9SPIO|nr:alanine dehydrogenase [Alkalispirochaeta americana]SIQ47438.1 L-alanine dehydrogenase [Alkalispirochaeta americana]
MKIGSVTEVKRQEYRVGMTPGCAGAYTRAGHHVLIQAGAGLGAGFTDQEYTRAGAHICDTPEEIYASCEMIVKVKEPMPSEVPLLRDGQILFTYLHLAAEETLTSALLEQGVSGVAYETVEPRPGQLPLLRPMSEIAGRLSVQEGARFLERPQGGRGVLLGGIPGVEKGKIAILGGGVVGTNAAKIALGLGAQVSILDVHMERLGYLDDIFQGRLTTLSSNRSHLEMVLGESDLVIGAVLVTGARAPRLITRSDLQHMKRGAVIVDVAIDQGGCVETARATTHDDPVYEVDGVLHYCVANMPGAVSRTSTQALTAVTLPYGLEIASLGLKEAARRSRGIALGVNTYRHHLTCPGVAQAFDLPHRDIQELLDEEGS